MEATFPAIAHSCSNRGATRCRAASTYGRASEPAERAAARNALIDGSTLSPTPIPNASAAFRVRRSCASVDFICSVNARCVAPVRCEASVIPSIAAW
jgi:hypothetical protein